MVVSGVGSEDTDDLWLSGQNQLYPLQRPHCTVLSSLPLSEMPSACLSGALLILAPKASGCRESRFRLHFSACLLLNSRKRMVLLCTHGPHSLGTLPFR